MHLEPSRETRSGPDPGSGDPDATPAGKSTTTGRESSSSAALHVRNYDVSESHSVDVSAVDPRNRTVFEARYRLQPGQCKPEHEALPAGTYTFEIRCDGIVRERGRCQIDSDWTGTAVIELGNGVVSITEGVY